MHHHASLCITYASLRFCVSIASRIRTRVCIGFPFLVGFSPLAPLNLLNVAGCQLLLIFLSLWWSVSALLAGILIVPPGADDGLLLPLLVLLLLRLLLPLLLLLRSV